MPKWTDVDLERETRPWVAEWEAKHTPERHPVTGRSKCGHPAAVREFNEATQRWEAVRDEDGNVLQKPCDLWSMYDTDPPRCFVHSAKRQRLADRDGERPRRGGLRGWQLERRFMSEMAETLGELASRFHRPGSHPMDELLEIVEFTGAMMRALAFLAYDLPVEPTIERTDEGVIAVEPGTWGHNHNGDQAPHVIVGLYGQWVDRHAKACKLALDADIDERLVRNAQATSGRLWDAFQNTLAKVALTEDQKATLARTLADEVRRLLLTGSPSPPTLDVGSRRTDP